MLKWKLMISTLPIVLVMAGVKLVLDLYFEFPGLVPFADVGVILFKEALEEGFPVPWVSVSYHFGPGLLRAAQASTPLPRRR